MGHWLGDMHSGSFAPPVERSLATLSSAKSPDFVVLKARLLPCISKMECGKQELSLRQWTDSELKISEANTLSVS